ncbi:MAG: MFS transporter [Rhodospirillaceae bacterium]
MTRTPPQPAPNPTVLTLIMCVAHVAIIMDAFTFATLIKTFEAEWRLSRAEQGMISGIYFACYVPAVPVLMALTDRIDARRIFMAGCLLIGAAAAGFGLFADGFWTAALFRGLSGLGFASAYMPGLRVLVDRFQAPWQSRAIAFYTSSWSLGTAVSFLAAGIIGEAFGWQAAFYAGAVAAAGAFVLVQVTLGPNPPTPPGPDARLFDFRPVLKNRPALGYMFSYAAHTWELLAFRAWLVAFLVFSLARQPEPMVGWFAEPARIATLSAIAAMASNVLGNEFAVRFGRVRVIVAIQIVTGAIACALGFFGAAPYALIAALVVVYAMLVQADSGSLTAGLVAAAEQGRRGATIAVYQVIGWIGGATGPVVVGIVLGLFADETPTAWGCAFIAMGGIAFLGAAILSALSGRGLR